MQVCLEGSPKIRHPSADVSPVPADSSSWQSVLADSTQHTGHWCHFLEHSDHSKPRLGLGASLNKRILNHSSVPGSHVAICEPRLLHVPAVLKQQQHIRRDTLIPQMGPVTAAL